MVGSARRSGPKPQARGAVAHTNDDLFESDVLFYKGGLRPQKSDTDGAASLPTLFEKRYRAPRAFGVPSFPMEG